MVEDEAYMIEASVMSLTRQKPYQFLGGPLTRAFGIIVLANLLFLLLTVAAPGDPDLFIKRVRAAFEMGELGLADYLPFDTHRGVHQYNDCNILQMLSNKHSSRFERALAPTLYATDENWNDQCAVLRALMVEGADPDTLLALRYTRYWHGYNALTAFALRGMELRDLRRLVSGAVWFAIGVLALATCRSGSRVRRTGLTISFAAASVWAVPYFAPGLSARSRRCVGPPRACRNYGVAGFSAQPRRNCAICSRVRSRSHLLRDDDGTAADSGRLAGGTDACGGTGRGATGRRRCACGFLGSGYGFRLRGLCDGAREANHDWSASGA
jgi:hypothetical protein